MGVEAGVGFYLGTRGGGPESVPLIARGKQPNRAPHHHSQSSTHGDCDDGEDTAAVTLDAPWTAGKPPHAKP
jgi:hypothetical protein